MLRTVFLIFQNEFRLLAKDRVGLFMLILAPVVIIAVAGFSLGDIYGARPGDHAYFIPVINRDHGEAAAAVIDALKRERSIAVSVVDDLARATTLIMGRDRAPLAILIPEGTTEALKAGRTAHVVLYVDPIKRIEVSAIELRLNELCRAITVRAQDQARQKLAAQGADLRANLDRLAGRLKALQSGIERSRRDFAQGREASKVALQRRMSQVNDDLERQTREAVVRLTAETKSALAHELAPRRDALMAVNRYIRELQSSEHDFERWFADLKAMAGSRSGTIPPPPTWPEPPTKEQLAVLSKPLELSVPEPAPPKITLPQDLAIKLPGLPALPGPELLTEIEAMRPAGPDTLPGNLGWSERSLTGGSAQVNAFDQYVPGFGVTFLLIGMLMGISLGLIDDRDWGTLQRLRVSGAPLAGTLVGKLLSRFLIGLLQMVLLFAIGWWLFGISLGANPIVLLLPAAAISFAAAAFGLVIACVARTHDSVMPVGAVVSMAMSAIGGCWWPIDFEPAWMRGLALWLPTTWTMQAFNDLMIRGLPAGIVWRPSAAVVGLGLIYLIAGIYGASRLYE